MEERARLLGYEPWNQPICNTCRSPDIPSRNQ
jgi:hypothetical protein